MARRAVGVRQRWDTAYAGSVRSALKRARAAGVAEAITSAEWDRGTPPGTTGRAGGLRPPRRHTAMARRERTSTSTTRS